LHSIRRGALWINSDLFRKQCTAQSAAPPSQRHHDFSAISSTKVVSARCKEGLRMRE
jgi:hypothetical protein